MPAIPRTGRRPALAGLLVFGAVALPAPLSAQVVEVGGGGSTLYRARGSFVRLHGERTAAGFDLGRVDRAVVGGFVRTRAGGWTLVGGDEPVTLALPRAIGDGGRSFLGRGLSVSRGSEDAGLRLFAGSMARGVSAPFFQAAEPGPPAMSLLADARIGANGALFVRSVVAGRTTAIAGGRWNPRPGFETAAGAGIGAGRGYGAAGIVSTGERWDAQLSYSAAARGYRNLGGIDPPQSEPVREAVSIRWAPAAGSVMAFAHRNLVQPLEDGGARAATLDQATAAVRVAGVDLSGATYRSRFEGRAAVGARLGVSRTWMPGWRLAVSGLHSRSGREAAQRTLLIEATESLGPRWQLLQHVTCEPSRTALAWGGRILTNPATVSAEYQTRFEPFRVSEHFQHSLMLDAKLRPWGSLQIHAGTQLSPEGRTHYTAYASTILEGPAQARGPRSRRLEPWMFRGRVEEITGAAVRGAALRVGRSRVRTDANGRFFVRSGSPRSASLVVALDEFPAGPRFAVVEAPARIVAVREDDPGEALIRLKRDSAPDVVPAVLEPPVLPVPELAAPPSPDVRSPEVRRWDPPARSAPNVRLAPEAVHFAFDSDRLSEASRAALRRLADALAAHPECWVHLEGHADHVGSSSYNSRLSLRRARAVRAELVQLGVAVDRITIDGVGSRRPRVSGREPGDRARNRCVMASFCQESEVIGLPEESDLQPETDARAGSR